MNRSRNIIIFARAIRKNRNNPTVLKITEFYRECKKFTYKVKFRKWITFYDIETAFQVILTDSDISEFTTEILVRLKLSIEQYQKKVKSKRTPLKGLKILVDVARKSIVI